MNKTTTIVSALFNFKREDIDGRKWSDYLKWFSIFLKLRAPMIIYTTKDLKEFITTRRKDLLTKIIFQKIEDIPYFYLYDQIKAIIDSKKYQNNIKDNTRIECKEPFYTIIQYSKFLWLENSVQKNTFDSDFYFWLDAGSGRFFKNYNYKNEFPSLLGNNFLMDIENSFLLQMNCDFYPDLYNESELDLNYLYDNRSFVLGSIFGGYKNTISKVSYLIEDILLNKMIKKGNINNEQIALGYIIKKYPEYFSIYCRKDKKHLSLFDFLSRV